MIFFNQTGKMAIGSRLRVLTDKITVDATSIYKMFGVGNIHANNIHEILHKEVEEGKSWLRVRNQAPCTDCVYHGLVHLLPKITVWRPDLCHVKE